MPEPPEYEPPEIDYSDPIERISELLGEDYSNIKDKLLEKLDQHIAANLSDGDDAENWLREGLLHNKDSKDGNCPFCGQTLENASHLIDVYHSYFDLAYTDFVKRIETGLSGSIRELENVSFSQKTGLQDALARANKYKELIAEEDFKQKLAELEKIIERLDENRPNDEKKKFVAETKTRADIKNKSPHKKVEPADCSDFKVATKSYRELLGEAEKIISRIRIRVTGFKKPYHDTSAILGKVDRIAQDVKQLEYKKVRIEQDSSCREYLVLRKEVSEMEENIDGLERDLEKDQSEYLENYFDEINSLFEKLGGRNFKLERVTERRGHLPVYSLKVRFRNEEIRNDQLKTVFSDSDRRALALAVFWAKINLKHDDEKARSIIVLDDPVTSFDDNRMTKSINLFKETLGQVDQMIIMTHYTNFIKRFCEITKEKQIPAKFLEIEQDNKTSFLRKSDRDNFVASEYQRAFTKIYDFINRKHSEPIKADLRPFLESFYLPTVFAKQISDRSVDRGSLESMIDGIFDDDGIRQKMHEFRTTLNPDSHLFTSALADILNLPVVDRRNVSGVHGSAEVNIHLAQIYVPFLQFTTYGRFAGVHLTSGGQVHRALIGRSFLRFFTMTYNGVAGSVELELKTAG